MLSPTPYQGLIDLQLPDYEPLFEFEAMRTMNYYQSGIVYGLCGLDRKIFYIGCTTNPNGRFGSRICYPSSLRVKRRMRELGTALRVVIIASTIPKNFIALRKLERDLITYHSDELINEHHNYFIERLKTKEYYEYRGSKSKLLQEV